MDLKQQGNEAFKKGDFLEATRYYSEGLSTLCEDESDSALRLLLLSNRAASLFHLNKYEDCVVDCSAVLLVEPKHLKCLSRRAKANAELENYEEALTDLDALLAEDPKQPEFIALRKKMQSLQDKRLEKTKEEMMNNLKGIGNSLLGHFGMSVDDFKFVQDPVTGSYSVSMGNKANDPTTQGANIE